jgi:hypothetical protein
MRGPAGYLAIIRMMRGGFPDFHWTLEEMVAEGDKVAARFITRARIGAPAAIGFRRGLWCSIKMDRPSRPAGQVWSVLLLRVTRILQLCYSGDLECPWAADAAPFYDVVLLAHAHP